MDESQSPNRINDVVASDVTPEDVEWSCEEPMIPRRGITVIAGRRGAMKTTLACWIAAEATRRGVNVFFASQEDDVESCIQPRMLAAGADMSRVFYPDKDEPPMRFPRDVARLDEYVRSRGIGLVILDPLSAFVPGFTSPAAARDALTPVFAFSRDNDCAVVFIHHFRKSMGRDVSEAIGGAGALLDIARAVYVCGEQPRVASGVGMLRGPELDMDKRVLACVKLNGAELPPSLLYEVDTVDVGLREEAVRVTLVGECDLTARDVFGSWVAALTTSGDTSALQEAKEFLYEMLKDGPQPSTAVQSEASSAGISWSTIKRAKTGIVKVYKQKDGWHMTLDVPDVIPEDWE